MPVNGKLVVLSQRRSQLSTGKPHSDIQSQTWFDTFLPSRWKPYTRLARFDRLIGAWLLFIPGLWSIWIAAGTTEVAASLPTAVFLTVLFGVGAIVMRAAGCVVNDLWDRDLDKAVTRTANRPLASGQIDRHNALVFLAVLLALGLIIVLLMRPVVLLLAVLSLFFVVLYPLAKRVTYWPQAVLGLTFNFGALMGAAAVTGTIPGWSILLYVGCFLWTIGYDTIYAHQDREDDLAIGVKSTALLFGDQTKPIVRGLFFASSLCWAGTLLISGAGIVAWIGLGAAIGTLIWQVRSIDIYKPEKCLALFKFSAWTGWLWAIALGADTLLRA